MEADNYTLVRTARKLNKIRDYTFLKGTKVMSRKANFYVFKDIMTHAVFLLLNILYSHDAMKEQHLQAIDSLFHMVFCTRLQKDKFNMS